MQENVQEVPKRGFTVIENHWLPLTDGTHLAARIWMPEGANEAPVPAVLEFLPYRKRNGTAQRDEANYPVFAAAGIAGVRVDLRGSGDSEGVLEGEMTPQQLLDAAEIIAWISAQPWSNGSVGMWGISWGGGNTLRVAGIQMPTALKAVIACSASVDRYRDMLRYKGGAHSSLNLSWQAQLTGYMCRPPDPEIVGECWLEMWRQRLENQPFYLEDWLSHQRRDAYWRHLSINEVFEQFPVPVLFACGWSDSYRNSPFQLVEGIPSKAKVLIGPWGHQYPHLAKPGPGTDFLTEAIAWWNHWLRDEPNGADKIPQMRAFILDGPRPVSRRERDPGYWVSMTKWTTPEALKLTLNASGTLVDRPPQQKRKRALLRSPLDNGMAAGELYTGTTDDQRIDDAGSLVFQSEVLKEECVLLGRPSLKLTLSSDSPFANIAVRLTDVHPDGAGFRISYGVLNLAHRVNDSEPKPLVPGKEETVIVTLDPCGYRIAPGHRVRLSISTAYWPIILPSPYDAAFDIDLASIVLSLPLLGEHELIEIAEPANLNPLPAYETLVAGETKRCFERDVENGITHYRTIEDGGLMRHPCNGLAERELREEIWSITAHDPLSMTGECRSTMTVSRPGWETVTQGVATLSCTKTEWIISQAVEAHHNGQKFFSRSRTKKIPRDFM
ncbi:MULTISPECIES: CocE/NonD family hydrolase [unclassified Sinorhizobium]|uniref:CocE/NonD family hydrolase n=1 Tax=unclassified Sinorhizobium TaxID=2613772 RepID=UPI0024C472E8|nr:MULTISPECIES: CocE/NonD family hydrolase [unclassified Sinorhizobium]MDK1378277.1 CocE/NonD family hydrolase [Sinorhizobium sp. 6-70]MDK1482374.1 CocE/NonD family hydrolase [Sinorhizobium sp. 6-117]